MNETTTFVYRIEHPVSHLGPYQVSKHRDKLGQDHTKSDNHPVLKCPNNKWEYSLGAYNLVQNQGAVFGCSSLKKLKDWFIEGDWLNILRLEGFILAKYEVDEDDCVHGEKQSVFISFQNRLNVLDWTEVLNA